MHCSAAADGSLGSLAYGQQKRSPGSAPGATPSRPCAPAAPVLQVQGVIQEGPRANLQAFLGALTALEGAIDFLRAHKHMHTAADALAHTSALRDRAVDAAAAEFGALLAKHSAPPPALLAAQRQQAASSALARQDREQGELALERGVGWAPKFVGAAAGSCAAAAKANAEMVPGLARRRAADLQGVSQPLASLKSGTSCPADLTSSFPCPATQSCRLWWVTCCQLVRCLSCGHWRRRCCAMRAGAASRHMLIRGGAWQARWACTARCGNAGWLWGPAGARLRFALLWLGTSRIRIAAWPLRSFNAASSPLAHLCRRVLQQCLEGLLAGVGSREDIPRLAWQQVEVKIPG